MPVRKNKEIVFDDIENINCILVYLRFDNKPTSNKTRQKRNMEGFNNIVILTELLLGLVFNVA